MISDEDLIGPPTHIDLEPTEEFEKGTFVSYALTFTVEFRRWAQKDGVNRSQVVLLCNGEQMDVGEGSLKYHDHKWDLFLKGIHSPDDTEQMTFTFY